jgi:hypothetical protein
MILQCLTGAALIACALTGSRACAVLALASVVAALFV